MKKVVLGMVMGAVLALGARYYVGEHLQQVEVKYDVQDYADLEKLAKKSDNLKMIEETGECRTYCLSNIKDLDELRNDYHEIVVKEYQWN